MFDSIVYIGVYVVSMWIQTKTYIALAVPSSLKFKFVPDVGLTPHVAP